MPTSRLVAALDRLALAAVLVGLGVAATGGFVETIAGVRVSMRTAGRFFILAALVAAIRLALDRTHPPFGPMRGTWPRLRALEWTRHDAYDAWPPAERRRASLLAAIGICAFGAALLHDQLRQLYSVPDYGDPLFSIWRLGWPAHQLLADPWHLFDANVFHPDRLTLTYSDSILLPALLAAPLHAIVHPVVAYNVVLLSGFFLSAWAVYGLVARLTLCPSAAFVSGLIFGFYPYRLEHYNHLELQMTWWMPLALLFVHRCLATGRTRDAVAAACCLAAQLYSSMYYFAFFGVCLAAAVAVWIAIARVRLSRLVRSALAGAVVLALVAAPLAVPYVRGGPIRGEQTLATVADYSARGSDYLRPHARSALYGSRLTPGRDNERALFPGLVPIALSATALVPPIGIATIGYAVMVAVAFDGSRGTNGVIYSPLYRWLWPFRSMRVAARFGMIVGLGLAVLAGFTVARLMTAVRSRSARRAILAALVVLLAVDLWPALDLHPVWREPPPIYESLRGDRSVVLAEFPLSSKQDDIAFSTAYMYFSRWHWTTTVNGYSGYYTARYLDLVHALAGFPTPAGIAALRSAGVTHVSVVCALLPESCDETQRRMDADSSFQAVVSTMWEGHPARLYRLKPTRFP